MIALIVGWVRAQSRPVRIDAMVSTAFGCSLEGVVPAVRVSVIAARRNVSRAEPAAAADVYA